MPYQIRYFFDPGSGVCLWSKNEETKNKFGYPIDHWELPLSKNTQYWLQHLIAWFDTSIDWDDPSGSSDFWTEQELKLFGQAAQKGFDLLQQELPLDHYVIIDETHV